MRYLFVCNVHPGPLTPLAAWLGRDPQNLVILATAWNRRSPSIPGIRLVRLKQPENRAFSHGIADFWQKAALSSAKAAASFRIIADSGFEPDIILLCSASGAGLGLPDVFPNAFRVAYLEDFGQPAREKRLLQCLQALSGHMAFALDNRARKIFAKLVRMPIGLLLPCLAGLQKSRNTADTVVFSLKNLSESQFAMWLEKALLAARAYPDTPFILLASSLAAQKYLSDMLAASPQSCNICVECGQAASMAAYARAKLAVLPAREDTAEIFLAAGQCCPILAWPEEASKLLGSGFLSLKDKNMLARALADPESLRLMGERGGAALAERFDCDNVLPKHLAEILAAREKFLKSRLK